MFAIESICKTQKSRKFFGLRETNLPYPVYDGSANYPKDIFGFTNYDEALAYLTKFINREGIDIMQLSTSQVVDLMLANNATKFQIVEYVIENDKINIIKEYPLPQFTRKD